MVPKIPFIATDNSITSSSQVAKDVPFLKTWLGEYSFSEYAPPNQNMFYLINIYFEDNNCFAEFSIDGFQRLERLSAKVSGDSNLIKFAFLTYLPDNMIELYKEGDILLSFKKTDSKLITYWEKLQPLLLENLEANEYFQLVSSPPSFSSSTNSIQNRYTKDR
mgnify:CR=1 FL=1